MERPGSSKGTDAGWRQLAFALLIGWVTGLTSSAANGPRQFLNKPDAWFAGKEACRVATNMLSHQSESGGWPKNIDTTASPFAGDRTKIKSTFDNGATTDELRFLARMFSGTRQERYCVAFEKGFDHILRAQYPSGGWPQSHPPGMAYHRYITFNDGSMVRLVEFLRETYTDERYRFLNSERRQAAREAFDRGIACILKCQVRVSDQLTAWCAQHDEVDFKPRSGRSYELASLSGAESVGIVRLLMSLDQPSPDVVRAVEAAVAWFQAARLTGIRVVEERNPQARKGKNKVVIQDSQAPPLWARFYEIASNRPLFVDRDGVPKYALTDIGDERRNGYAWYGDWPRRLLEDEYPAWKRKLVTR